MSRVKLALVGRDISHSRSPYLYQEHFKIDCDYDLLDFDSASQIPSLETLSKTYLGINITAPFKTHFFNHILKDEEIENLGSINCISFQGSTSGTNTDYTALQDLIPNTLTRVNPDHIILLGNGVMADLTKRIFKKLNIRFNQFSRSLETDPNIKKLDQGKTLVINSCNRDFIYQGLHSDNMIFWDYNYSFEPHQSLFQSKSSTYIDGMSLLELQAKHCLQYWGL